MQTFSIFSPIDHSAPVQWEKWTEENIKIHIIFSMNLTEKLEPGFWDQFTVILFVVVRWH